eukprot:symbB.v1.2.039711.t1/scaffold6726.1/size15933/2
MTWPDPGERRQDGEFAEQCCAKAPKRPFFNLVWQTVLSQACSSMYGNITNHYGVVCNVNFAAMLCSSEL